MCQEAVDLERSNGGERAASKCRKGEDHDLLYGLGPPAEFRRVSMCCHTGVGSNIIFCNGCKHWVHKKCSGLKRLTKDPDYRCTWQPRWLIWMCRLTGDQEVAGSTPTEVGNILSWRLIMKYFLRSFSPFH